MEEDLVAGRTDHRGVLAAHEQSASREYSVMKPTATRAGGGLDPSLNSIDLKATMDLQGPPPDRFRVCYHVIEVCGGVGGIGGAAIRQGCRTLNMDLQLGWDVLDAAIFRWLVRMGVTGRCFFMMLEAVVPPCRWPGNLAWDVAKCPGASTR